MEFHNFITQKARDGDPALALGLVCLRIGENLALNILTISNFISRNIFDS
jgi:hypothetical protein